LVSHCTHCDVAGSQSGLVAGQSVFELHPTHTPPFAVLQIGASLGHDAFVVHAGWHV
jgi:hypothetical protein